MRTFEVKEDFILDGKKFKIMSGAIHYFRVAPEDWYHSLFNLKALGFNTVETYIPWNLHEEREGEFSFSNQLDIKKFVQLAAELDLLVILRPSPYICAEWEFGGLPAWLLKYKKMRIRSSDQCFIDKVNRYFESLFSVITPLQITEGGPVIMMQVENEYGSYGEDKEYLLAIMKLMKKYGVKVPLFTSDGPWHATQRAGSMIEENILSTGNFGSNSRCNFDMLEKFHLEHQKKWPLMCMEFWDGWFNRWGEEIIKRDPDELASAVKEALEIGSVNLYMFHGGTNFGFMNGCSARGRHDLHQITSYDYDAPLNEQGNPTPKYYALKKMLKELFPEIIQKEPLIKKLHGEITFPLTNKVSLFSVIDQISVRNHSKYPQSMEELDHYYGYQLYRTKVKLDSENEFFRVIDANDRMHFFINENCAAIQYQEEIGEKIEVSLDKDQNQIDILIENMGRVNYGHKLLAETQRKGIRGGVMADLHFLTNWEQYSLDFSLIESLDFSGKWKEGTPSFYQYTFDLKFVEDTYLNLEKFGKGIVLVNGTNIGRFWDIGPTLSLFIPKSLLKQTNNQIIIFETDGKWSPEIKFSSPINSVFYGKEGIENEYCSG